MAYPPEYDEGSVAYLSGVDAQGRVAAFSFHTWAGPGATNPLNPYLSVSEVRKWGSDVAGTGAIVTFGFNPSSHWTPTEQSSFVAAMHLWQAEANIHFVTAANPVTADILFTRGSDGKAASSLDGTSVAVASDRVGVASRAEVRIDTSVVGFGSLGGSLGAYGGYPWMTELHEIGHAIGLGHAGAYNGAGSRWSGATLDNRAMTIMSYYDASNMREVSWGSHDGYEGVPTTTMIFDIVAAQRLYGVPTDGPLSGDVVFGFNSNIQGDIRQFFDFTVNTQPVVTLWAGGTHSTLDVSGFAQNAFLNLLADYSHSSSAGGLLNNIYIAPGTRITSAITGAGNDTIAGNNYHDVLIGGAGKDSIYGGSGNDHIYGGGMVQTPGDGADDLRGGDGSDYLQGNAGNDTLDGGEGSDRLYGGAGDDSIYGDAGNDTIQGNLGNDTIDGGDGNDVIRGGQGNDTIQGNAGSDVVMGDLGDDRIDGGRGLDTLIGGAGADVFYYHERAAMYETHAGWANYYVIDEVADFEDGVDHIRIDAGIPSTLIQLGVLASVQAASELATPLLQSATNANANFGQVATAQVGSDTIFLFWGAGEGMQAARIDNLNVANFTVADFI